MHLEWVSGSGDKQEGDDGDGQTDDTTIGLVKEEGRGRGPRDK
jgi:hypothetical protein